MQLGCSAVGVLLKQACCGLVMWLSAGCWVLCRYTDAVNSIGGAGLQKLFLLNSLQQTAGT